MSANLEQHADCLLVLCVGGELKKSELDAVQSEFVKKSPVPEPSSFSCYWKILLVGNAASSGAIRTFSSAIATTLRKLPSSAIHAGKHRCWRSQVRAFAKDR